MGRRQSGSPALDPAPSIGQIFVARYNEVAEAENSKNGDKFPLSSREILKAVGTDNP
jgi:hypothetical protein